MKDIQDEDKKKKDAGQDEQNAEEKSGRKRKQIIWIAVAAVCVVVVFLCGWSLGKSHSEQQRQEDLKALAAAAPTATPTPQSTPKPTPTSEEEPKAEPTPLPKGPNEREIDFDKYLEENPDVIGWLEVGGTTIDYPLVSSLINDYYLTHDFFREESAYGAIYIDIRNNADMTSPLTVIYGHNMKDGSMFADLHQFEDEDFFNANKVVRIYTPDGQLTYKIFAAFKRDNLHLMATGNADFTNEETMQEYLADIEARGSEPGAYVNMDGVTTDDHILALSTCVMGEDENRYVVHAKLVSPDE